MAKQSTSISPQHQSFIEQQKIFFVATATAAGRINLSPKGMDTFRVLDATHIAWLNVTGSGNETAAHLRQSNRMTLMFCSFDDNPQILRLYGTATAFHPHDQEWSECISLFPALPGARQVIRMDVNLVQTSCGFGVPLYDFVGHRDTLNAWAHKKGEDGIRQYWEEKNQTSLDGEPTGILVR